MSSNTLESRYNSSRAPCSPMRFCRSFPSMMLSAVRAMRVTGRKARRAMKYPPTPATTTSAGSSASSRVALMSLKLAAASAEM